MLRHPAACPFLSFSFEENRKIWEQLPVNPNIQGSLEQRTKRHQFKVCTREIMLILFLLPSLLSAHRGTEEERKGEREREATAKESNALNRPE